MAHPVPRAPKRTPLPSALGGQAAPTGQSPSGQLPTVEEVSAGGVVVEKADGELRVAIIARINRGGRLEWCLPKGHPEGVETHAEAAVREIEEETGIAGDILAPLGSIDYWFTVSGHRVHKTVHHFLLRATGGFLTIENDPDHEAVDVAWVPIGDLGRRLSFPNERRIADLARDLLPSDF
jgi:8-oxo-dGTP pyrophosphatase MutT (NUDIX family)